MITVRIVLCIFITTCSYVNLSTEDEATRRISIFLLSIGITALNYSYIEDCLK